MNFQDYINNSTPVGKDLHEAQYKPKRTFSKKSLWMT